MITNEYSVRWNDINLRNVQKKDIAPFKKYWYQCPGTEHIREVIDFSNFPSEKEFELSLLNKIKNSDPNPQVVIYKGNSIGAHTLTFEPNNEVCIHAHFWDLESRGKRIAFISGLKAMSVFFDKLELEEIYLKPPTSNKMSSRVMEKSGLSPIREEVYSNPIIKDGTIVNVYKVKKRELSQLEAAIKPYFS